VSTILLLDVALRITVFGLTISSSWGNGHATPYRAILRALHKLGHQVTFFEKDVEYYYWRRDFTSCDYCSLVLYPDWRNVRQQALSEAAQSDVVILGSYCPDGARIADEILSLPGLTTVVYDLDTPITLSNLEHGDLDYIRRDQMGEFDLYLSFTGGGILDELERKWNVRRARALYGCVDPEVHARVPVREEFRCDLSYMGTYAADRQQRVQDLLVRPAQLLPQSRFVLAGCLYPKEWVWPENVRHYDHVRAADHPALYSSSRATLNITRDGMARGGYCPSGRFFEAAACGTAILSDWFQGIETFFRADEEILIVSSPEQVISALRLPEGELASLAAQARERTLSEHTGEARAQQLLRYLDEVRQTPRVAAAAKVARKKDVEVTT
jgi:spore maturation protein CgeB